MPNDVMSEAHPLVRLFVREIRVVLLHVPCPQRPVSHESTGCTRDVLAALLPRNRESIPPVLRHDAAGPMAATSRVPWHDEEILICVRVVII